MPSTPLRAIPFPTTGDAATVPAHIQQVAEALDDAPRWARGSQAAAVSTGQRRIYEATDQGRIHYDTGTALVELARAAQVLSDLETLRAAAGLSTPGGAVRHGKSIIAPEGSRSDSTYGALSNGPDQVANVVLPADGLLRITFHADWKESVAGAGRAAIFLNANQLQIVGPSATGLAGEAALTGTPGLYSLLESHQLGLAAYGTSASYAGYNVTTGLITARAEALVEAAAGTYTVSVQFKASSGTVHGRARKLWVKTEVY